MKKDHLQIVILGLSITSSWGNGHATTYRCLIRELKNKGHDIVFLERIHHGIVHTATCLIQHSAILFYTMTWKN